MFEKIAYAADTVAAPQGPGALASLLPFIIIFVIFYFLMIRPQQKRQTELSKMIGGLKKGDKVVTAGGMIGVVTSIQTDYVVLKVGDNEATKIEVLKSSISGLRA